MIQSHTNLAETRKRAFGIFLGFFFLSIALAFQSCAAKSSRITAEELLETGVYLPENPSWENIAPGLQSFRYKNAAVPLRYSVVKIDLSVEGLELFAHPAIPEDGGEFKKISIKRFAEKTQSHVAFNVSPFESILSAKTKIIGIHKVSGAILSEPTPNYACILFTAEKSPCRAFISINQNDAHSSEFPLALGGFFVVLKNGTPVDSFKNRLDSRMGAGLSADGRTMIILAVEGENPSESVGLSYLHCAGIFLSLGCTDAIEFDGGGSTSLLVNGSSFLSYEPFRKSVNYLGIKSSK